jgi:glycine hydroxymethyltransferase
LVCFKVAQSADFKKYAAQVVNNAKALAKALIDHGFKVLTEGTDCHMFLIDTTSIGLTGKEAEKILEQVGVYVNKNAIPFDPNPPAVSGGIRIGTPLATSLGLTEPHMQLVADFIKKALLDKNQNLAETVKAFCIQNYQIPDWLKNL